MTPMAAEKFFYAYGTFKSVLPHQSVGKGIPPWLKIGPILPVGAYNYVGRCASHIRYQWLSLQKLSLGLCNCTHLREHRNDRVIIWVNKESHTVLQRDRHRGDGLSDADWHRIKRALMFAHVNQLAHHITQSVMLNGAKRMWQNKC